MRSVLCSFFVAGTVFVCIGGAEASLLSGKAILYESPVDVRHVTFTTDQLSELEVALVTSGPGPHYRKRFGHNAIIIDDPAGGTRMAYNYGVFDFQEERFLLNFALGHMRYSLGAEPLDIDLATYVTEGRSVTVQMLNLTPAQARQLAAFLVWNAQPRNAVYRYDYLVTRAPACASVGASHISL